MVPFRSKVTSLQNKPINDQLLKHHFENKKERYKQMVLNEATYRYRQWSGIVHSEWPVGPSDITKRLKFNYYVTLGFLYGFILMIHHYYNVTYDLFWSSLIETWLWFNLQTLFLRIFVARGGRDVATRKPPRDQVAGSVIPAKLQALAVSNKWRMAWWMACSSALKLLKLLQFWIKNCDSLCQTAKLQRIVKNWTCSYA